MMNNQYLSTIDQIWITTVLSFPYRQHVQVPKMEVLNLKVIFGVGFPLHKPYIQLI